MVLFDVGQKKVDKLNNKIVGVIWSKEWNENILNIAKWRFLKGREVNWNGKPPIVMWKLSKLPLKPMKWIKMNKNEQKSKMKNDKIKNGIY